MRRRHTRRTDQDLAGPSIQRAIRIPEVQVLAVRDEIAKGLPDIHSLTDAVIDALWLWLYENQRSNGHVTVEVRGEVAANTGEAVSPSVEPTEPTEADRPYQGTHERPSWSDVDVAALDG